MRIILALLKPTPLGIILILLALLLQALICSTSSTVFSLSDNHPLQSSLAFGLGSPITVITADGKTHLSVKWLILALNLAVTYVLAVLTGNGFARITHLQRPATAYGLVAGVMIAAALLVSIGISKACWGYFISRPALLSEVDSIAQVKAIVPFKTDSSEPAKRVIVADPDYSLSDRIANGKKDSYYCLDARILIELEKKQLLPTAPAKTLAALPDLYPLIQNTGTLANSTKGYDSAALLSGVVVDAVDGSGARLVFLGLTGGQLSNDHYPYYEMLFRGKQGGTELRFARSQRFFYDVAGMEGFEWYAIWPYLSALGIVAGFVIFTIGKAASNWKARSP